MEVAIAMAYASGLVARGALALPAPVKRALAGPVPEVAAGLDPDMWLIARLAERAEQLSSRRPAPPLDISRAAAEAQSRFLVRRTRRPVRTAAVDLGGVPGIRYVPVDPVPGAVLVFFHGGGWVNRTAESHGPAVRNLADLSGVEIVSVEYRRAPEDPFPAAADDALTAYLAARDRFPGRVAVGGDSAGGNLAASVCVTARERDLPLPHFQFLLYPAVDGSKRYQSTADYTTGFFLTEAAMDRYTALYMEGHESDPRASPLLADPAGLPPAYVATALADPLRDEGEAYAAQLEHATLHRFPLLHGFFNATVVPAARDAVAVTAGALRAGMA